jgi:hypothetical protein
MQSQQDALNTVTENTAASLNNEAQQLNEEAAEAAQLYGCDENSVTPECIQADELAAEADDDSSQAITTLQNGADQQAITSINETFTNVPQVIPCSGGPSTGANQCYNGYELNPETQLEVQTQYNNIYSEDKTAEINMSQINNGNQGTVVTASQSATQQADALVQSAIAKGAIEYQQEQGSLTPTGAPSIPGGSGAAPEFPNPL